MLPGMRMLGSLWQAWGGMLDKLIRLVGTFDSLDS